MAIDRKWEDTIASGQFADHPQYHAHFNFIGTSNHTVIDGWSNCTMTEMTKQLSHVCTGSVCLLMWYYLSDFIKIFFN
jgi:hypothetical protein